MKEYQCYLTPGFEPFEPLELARETEKIVTRVGEDGLERKYEGIYSAPVGYSNRLRGGLLPSLYLLLVQLVERFPRKIWSILFAERDC